MASLKAEVNLPQSRSFRMNTRPLSVSSRMRVQVALCTNSEIIHESIPLEWTAPPNKRVERTRHERASLLGCVGELLKRNVRRISSYVSKIKCEWALLR